MAIVNMDHLLTRLLLAPLCIVFIDAAIAQDSTQTARHDTTAVRDTVHGAIDSVTTSRSAASTKDTVNYEADVIEYDIPNKVILMRGNSVVRYHAMTLFADTIHFLFNEDLLVATGTPQLVEGVDTVAGDNMVYNLKTGRGRVRYGTAHSEDSRYDGTHITRSDDRSFYIEDGSYTSCVYDDSSHYCFYGKHIKVTPGDKAISRPVVLDIGQAPVMALPYYILPLEHGRQSGWLSPRWGGHVTHGGHIDNIGYYWAPNDYTDYTLAGKVTEFSSYVLSTQARYALRYKLSGGLSARYSTSSSSSYDTLNNLWGIDYTHNQNILPDESMKLSGRGSVVSGKSFYKSVSEDTTELINQQINANMSLTKSFQKINGYGSVTWNRTHNFKTNTIDQDLPSFAFNLSPRPLIPRKEDEATPSDATGEKPDPWYNKITYSYNVRGNKKYNYNEDIGREKSLFDNGAIGQDFGLSAPMTIFKWFSITPQFSLHHALFDAYIDTTAIRAVRDSVVYETDSIVPENAVVTKTIINGSDTTYTFIVDTIPDTFVVYDTINYRSSRYSFRDANTSSWNTGASISTRLYGIFPIKIFNFAGIRHTFTPTVSYTLIPEKQLQWRYPNVGITAASPGERRQVVRFSVDNLFQGKVLSSEKKEGGEPIEKKFTMLSAGVSASYDFEAKTRNWSDISLSASIPNNLIDFSYSATFTPYGKSDQITVPELMNYTIRLSPKLSGASGSLWGGDFLLLEGIQPKDYMKGYADLSTPGWNVTFNPSYSFSRSRNSLSEEFKTTRNYQLSTSARIKFSPIWSAAWNSSFDFTENRFMNHSVNFACDLECWDLKFDWYPSGVNAGYFYFIVKIKKHPDIKWVERP